MPEHHLLLIIFKLILNNLESCNYYYYFHVNLLLCVYQLENLIQNLLRRRQKDLLIVQLPAVKANK